MRGLRDLLEKGKNLKKSDWLLLALLGILLLIIAMPVKSNKKESESTVVSDTGESEQAAGNTLREQQAYVATLEKKLESVLGEMDGIGKVKVMIMAEDTGERLVEKDVSRETRTTTDTKGEQAESNVSESSNESSTVYVEDESGKYPYVQKEKLPVIGGVIVVAEGAKNTQTVTRITEAVTALFAVEAHRVKVLPMK